MYLENLLTRLGKVTWFLPAAANGCAMPAKQKGKRPNVSFSDELEEESEDPPILSLAESTKKRC